MIFKLPNREADSAYLNQVLMLSPKITDFYGPGVDDLVSCVWVL